MTVGSVPLLVRAKLAAQIVVSVLLDLLPFMLLFEPGQLPTQSLALVLKLRIR